jgi:hypothetical protein
MRLGIAEALVRSPERPVPIIPPDLSPAFPANQRIQQAILVKDRRQHPVANFLGCSRKYPLLPPLRPTLVDRYHHPLGHAHQGVQVAVTCPGYFSHLLVLDFFCQSPHL